MTLPAIGKPAPDFELLNQDGESVRLSSLRGRNVILYFYPKAMTPGCTVQACGLRDARARRKSLNVEVLAVSPDPVKRLQKFVERDSLDFTLLSDPDHAVAETYGSWGLKKFMGREYMGVLRQTFVVDAEGVLRHAIANVKTKTHHDDVLDWVQENL